MRYPAGHRTLSRDRIVQAVGRGFRTAGYAGVGVDGLAKVAGVTSGAFYGHFRSKAEAFRAAVVAGLTELKDAVVQLQTSAGKGWIRAFADFYLTEKVSCPPAEACALPSLSPEVARADDEIKSVYETELLGLVATIEAGLPARWNKPTKRKTAWALLAQLAGGVMLARAVKDPSLAHEIASAIRQSVDDRARSSPSPGGVQKPSSVNPG